MSSALLERVATIKAKNSSRVEAEGSNWHPKSDNKAGRRFDGRSTEHPTIEKDLIAFRDRFYVKLVGEDATKAEKHLKELHAGRADSIVYGTLSDDVKAILLHPDIIMSSVEGVQTLSIHVSQWNDFLRALEMAGLMVTETGVNG
jgi:hypothetical protein